MTYEQLRTEFTKPSFRNELKNKLGCACANCESTENIEYHHIVPLINGGTNRLTNIVPLCVECHNKAHDKNTFKAHNGGRPKLIDFESAEPILKRYFNLEIGTKETKELMGMSPQNRSTWCNLTKEYRKKYNISPKFKNTIDILNSQNRRIKTLKENRINL